MGKNPAFQFYPGDWTRDMDDHSLEIEGAWIRILCRLWWSEIRGESKKTLSEWARILRKTEKKTEEILKILIEKHIADGSILDNQNITIISRRMKRDEYIRQVRRASGSMGGNPQLKKPEIILDNQSDNQNPTPSSSVLQSSTSIPICPHHGIVKLYNDILGNKLPHVRIKYWEGSTASKNLVARWKQDPKHQTMEYWKGLFEYIRDKCPFLVGENDKKWNCDLRWIVNKENFIKIVEAKYERR